MIGIIRRLRLYTTNAVITALERELRDLKDREIPRLKRELDLEKGENIMLKEKLALWRLQQQADSAVKAAAIANA